MEIYVLTLRESLGLNFKKIQNIYLTHFKPMFIFYTP